ncbi:glycosyltransferase [Cetobacterium somerae]
MKINLCETNLDGHHNVYLENLLNIDNTSKMFIDTKIEMSKKRIFKYIFDRKKLMKKFLLKENEIYHLLYLDMLYTYFPLIPLNRNKIVLGTLHFVPNNKIKIILLKNFAKKIDLIIVHSEILKQSLLNLGIKNVEVIDYPSFYDYSKIKETKDELKKKYKLEKKIVLTALGGTRQDKGLDIFLEAFKYLDNELKSKVVVNIAGKEENFQKEFIRKMSQEYNIELREQYGFLTDEDFMKNILVTDIMIIPYRKIFGGNSGPMTEAIVNRIPCITPKGLNIGYLTEKYNLGLTFECENSKDLAKIIAKMILNIEKKQILLTNYREKLTVETFLKRHKEIYKNLKEGEYK